MNVRRIPVVLPVSVVFLVALALSALPRPALAGANLGTATVTVSGPGLVDLKCPANGVEFWDVQPGKSITLTLSGVTECSGDSIPLTLSWTPTPPKLMRLPDGTYSATFDVPLGANCTTPIKYCATNQFAHSTCSPTQQVHLRATDSNGNLICNATCVCTAAPVMAGCPDAAPLTVQCYNQVPTPPTVTASDNCGAVTVSLSPQESNPGSSCSNTITRTWTATNGCGTATCTQTIIVNNTTPPSLTVDTTKLAGCYKSNAEAAAAILAASSSTDTCGTAITPSVDGGTGTCQVTFNVTAVDSCGNPATPVQVTVKVDGSAPSVTCRGDVTVYPPCGPPAPYGFTAKATVVDNCDSADRLAISATVNNSDSTVSAAVTNAATGEVTITGTVSDGDVVSLTATDTCGNASVPCHFTVHVDSVPCSTVTITKSDSGTGGPLGGFKFVVNYTDPRDGSAHTVVSDLTSEVDGSATITTMPVGAAYSICEILPTTGTACKWVQTYPVNPDGTPACYQGTATDSVSARFSNICVCPPLGGLTLGFWSNKNGQSVLAKNDPAWENLLNGMPAPPGAYLRTAAGGFFAVTSYSPFRTWLLGATATNMAYMLSAQLAAAQLNVLTFGKNSFGGLDPNTTVVLPAVLASCYGSPTANLSKVISEAIAALQADGHTISGDPNRPHQECLKTILDGFNNNTFPQVSGACDKIYP